MFLPPITQAPLFTVRMMKSIARRLIAVES